MRATKVFCVGFHKTATTSLANALYVLGHRLTDSRQAGQAIAYADLARLEPTAARAQLWDALHPIADRMDAVQDTPWFVLYRELDQAYPGSKFVLTVRDTDRWVRSVVNHFGTTRIPAHEWIYGVPCATGHEDVLRATYDRHNREVQDYFADRPGDLLVLPIEQLAWEPICDHLGVEVPGVPFPRENVGAAKNNSLLHRVRRVARNRVMPRVGRPDDYELCLAVWNVCYEVVSALEPRLGVVPPPTSPQGTPGTPTDDALGEALRTAHERLTRLRRELGEPASEPVDDATWQSLVIGLRGLAGSTAYHNVHDRTSDGVRRDRAIIGLCEELATLLSSD